jgi:succinate dehydrogenase hydrophobic anchor subunit
MQESVTKQQARQSLAWIGQAVSGVLLIVIVLLHLIFHHFQEGLLSASQVVAHVASPTILTLEILFIIVVTYHALLGIKAVLFDLQLSDAVRKRWATTLTILGIITVVYGVILAIMIRSQTVV